MVLAEALILGKLVISTNASGPTGILDGGKYGLLVENSTEGIYKGMKTFLENPETVEYYKNKAIERSNYFNSDEIIKQIEAIL